MTARPDWRAVDDATRYFQVGVGTDRRAPDAVWIGMARGRDQARAFAVSAARQAWRVASLITGEDPTPPPHLLETTSCEDSEPEVAQGIDLHGVMLARLHAARRRRASPWRPKAIEAIAMAALSTAASRAMMPPSKMVVFEYGADIMRVGDPTPITLKADLMLGSGDDLWDSREPGSLAIPVALRGAITAIAAAQAAICKESEACNGVAWPEVPSMAAIHRAALARTADDDATKVAVFLGQAGLSEEALAFLQAYGRRPKA